MNQDILTAWKNFTADTLVSRGPSLLHAVLLLTSSDGGDITIYEGQDANSGTKIARLEGNADTTKVVRFSPPLPCQRGLYVDVGSSVTEVTVHYSQLAKNYRFSE
jgi:hypothetical protein